MTTIVDRQIEIEKLASDFSYDRLMKEINSRIQAGQADELSEGKLILVHSIDIVAKKIAEYFELDIRGKMKGVRDLVALEFYEKPKDLAFILLATIVRSISQQAHIPAIQMIKLINMAIHDSIVVRRLDKSDTTFGSFVDRRYKNRSEAYRIQQKLKIAKRQSDMVAPDLNAHTTLLGATLLDIVVKSGCNIIEFKKVRTKNKTVQHIVYTEECFKMVLQSRSRLLNEYRKYPILVAPPVDWESFSGSGGYYSKDIYKLPLIKSHGSSKALLREYFKAKEPQQLFDTVNTLQQTPWRVNKKVFEVIDKILTDNIVDPESVHNNPYLIGKLPYSGDLEAEDFININNYGEINTEGRYKGLPKEKEMMGKYFVDLEEQRDIVMAIKAKAFMAYTVMYNAREYLDEEEIYFSYQYDFRGRIYPVQQHLQPQGKSEVKALLEFKNGCRLTTEEEEYWFMVHGANCYGYDKELYDDRVRLIKEKHEDIMSIAENPIKHQNLWKDTDSPFLFIAWCFEYADYITNPSTFVSRIPIALDATCSGIQIYSGLLRDKEGALAVNVIGSTRNDIYGEVATKVNEYLSKGEYPKSFKYTTSDGKDHDDSVQHIADSLKGKVTRQLTKRNTMTQPYSVTKFGMYEQLLEELNNMEKNNKKFWVGENWLTAKLLTELNDRAIAEVVKGARVGQEFLKEVTKEVVGKGSWVFYTTPITEFPVLQKIHKTSVERVETPVGKLSIRTTLDEINQRRMVNGIAPNFIHSLDATLLAYTVLKLREDGCTNFHLVHDSYGVPVNQVVNLNKRVREAFVELFQANPLEKWVAQVNTESMEEAENVMINTLALEEVLDSGYIFS